METIQIVRKCMLYIDWQPSIEVFRVGIFSLKWYSLLWMFGLMFTLSSFIALLVCLLEHVWGIVSFISQIIS